MRMNHSDIRQQLLDEWEGQLAHNHDPYDLLREFSDSAVPVYNSEIIKDWQEMPSEFNDAWQDYVIGEVFKRTITDLMQLDLFNYYQHEYHKIYNELCNEMEATND